MDKATSKCPWCARPLPLRFDGSWHSAAMEHMHAHSLEDAALLATD